MTVLQRRLSEPIVHERGPVACLVLHGFGGSPAEVRPLADYLAARGLSVRAPLLPGHGTTPDDMRHMHWTEWVRAAEEELRALQEGYGAVHAVGFSMGGLLSLYLAAHHSVASLATLSAPVRLADWRQIFVPLARYVVRDYPARISNPALAAQLDSYDRFPLHAVNSLIHLTRRVRKDLHRVTAPILIMQGDRDRWIAAESAEQIAANVSSQVRRVKRLAERNHLITLEHGREEVFEEVYAWTQAHAR